MNILTLNPNYPVRHPLTYPQPVPWTVN